MEVGICTSSDRRLADARHVFAEKKTIEENESLNEESSFRLSPESLLKGRRLLAKEAYLAKINCDGQANKFRRIEGTRGGG